MTAAGAGIGLLASCASDHGGGKSASPSFARPLDKLRFDAKRMAPAAYAASYEVGPGASYPTIKAAAEAVAADQAKELGITAGGPPVAQAGPWRRRRIVVQRGTYPEGPLALPPFTDLVGASGDPHDVVITASGKDNVIGTGGRSCYLAHITFRQTSDSPIAHPINDSGYAGDAGLGPLQRRTVIVDNCVMDASRAGLAGKGAADLTPGPGTTLVFNKVSFLSPGQPQAISCVVGTGEGTNPTSVVFLDSHVQANYERHADPGIAGSGEGPSFPVGLVQASAPRRDTYVWAGGTWDIGRGGPKTGIGALLACGYDQSHTKKSTATWHLVEPGSQNGAKTSWVVPGTQVSSTLPGSFKLPAQGTSDQEAEFFGRRPPRAETKVSVGVPTSEFHVEAGKIYWIALDLEGQAVFSRAVLLGAKSDHWAAGLALDAAGRPTADVNGLAAGAAVATSVDRAPVAGRWFFPGQGHLWVGVAFGEAVTVPALKSLAGSAYSGEGYVAGAAMPVRTPSLTPLSAGTLVPALTVTSSLPDSYPE